MRVIFLATPEFALPSLYALASRHTLCCVVTRKDAIGDRRTLVSPRVKIEADRLGLPVIQTDDVNTLTTQLREYRPDVLITCAFGQLLKGEILSIAKYGVLNIHASLLPKYRGASPISAALRCGESVTGITVMRTVLALDAGDILCYDTCPIELKDNLDTLTHKLSLLGADTILNALNLLEQGRAQYLPQEESQATYCKKITENSRVINWDSDAKSIVDHIRSLSFTPCAYTTLDRVKVKIITAHIADSLTYDLTADVGTVILADKTGIAVRCANGALYIDSAQFAGKKALTYRDLVNGRQINKGQVFGK